MTVLPTRSAASAVNETVPPALGWATSTRPSRTAVFSQWAPSTVTGTRTSARALPVLSRDSAGVKRTTEVGISVIPSAYAEENLTRARRSATSSGYPHRMLGPSGPGVRSSVGVAYSTRLRS